MIVGFTGTRRGPTPRQHDAMRLFLSRIPMTRFIHGGAKGCDTMADHIVRQAHPGIFVEIYPCPDNGSTVWLPRGNGEVHSELPPLERNRVIVRSIHGLLAAPQRDTEDWGSGTWATIRYARELRLPVYVALSDGLIVRDG